MLNRKLIFIILILPLLLSGCIFSIKQSGTSVDDSKGGLFRSQTLGDTWSQVTTLYTLGGKTARFDAANVTAMAFDALDDSSIYLGTQQDGLFYSYNYGDGWFQTLGGRGTVNDVLVDPQDSCTIYAAVHNTIYRSTDCSRNWQPVYFETLQGKYVTALAISNRDNKIVYAGTSGGTLLKSNDYGISWDAMNRFDDNIKEILVLEDQTAKTVYAVTQQKGLYKSEDEGLSWTDLRELSVDQAEVDEDALFKDLLVEEQAKKEKNNRTAISRVIKDKEEELGRDLTEAETEAVTSDFKYLTTQEIAELERTKKYLTLSKVGEAKVVAAASLDRSLPDSIIYAGKGTVYRLVDGKYGKMWQQIKLLTPQGKEVIYSVLVNPQNPKELFYGTSIALYHSVDGGQNWSVSALPTNYSARFLSFSLDNKFLYLGAYKIKK